MESSTSPPYSVCGGGAAMWQELGVISELHCTSAINLTTGRKRGRLRLSMPWSVSHSLFLLYLCTSCCDFHCKSLSYKTSGARGQWWRSNQILRAQWKNASGCFFFMWCLAACDDQPKHPIRQANTNLQGPFPKWNETLMLPKVFFLLNKTWANESVVTKL